MRTRLALGGEVLSARQKRQLTEKFLAFAGRYVTRRRCPPRSCPRAVRQPVSGWPRLNTKDFLRLGVPLGEPTRRATDFVSKFILGGASGSSEFIPLQRTKS